MGVMQQKAKVLKISWVDNIPSVLKAPTLIIKMNITMGKLMFPEVKTAYVRVCCLVGVVLYTSR